MIFDDMIGQEKVIGLLTESVLTDKVGHAYLFFGPDGIGRKSIAKKFVKEIMCTGDKNDETCKCLSCTLFEQENNPDLVIVSEEKGKSSIGVETIRNIQDDMITAPLYGKKKVYIIDHSEKMTVAAQNALLKTLEEPPSYVMIILICSNLSLILETVLSRVVKIDFVRYSDKEIIEAVNSSLMSKEDISLLCVYADGIIGRAINLQQDPDIEKIRSFIFDIPDNLISNGFDGRRNVYKFLEQNDEKKEFIFFSLISCFRDIMIRARYGRNSNIQNRAFSEKIEKAAQCIGYARAMDCVAIVDNTWKQLGRNVNYKLSIETMLIDLQEVIYD